MQESAGSEITPPLVVILKTTDTVKRNLATLESEMGALTKAVNDED